MSRLEDAVQIRDAAVKKIHEEGKFENMENSGPVPTWKAPRN
jgi:hypothetical protein